VNAALTFSFGRPDFPFNRKIVVLLNALATVV
jgi:hypothetical protein